MTAPEPLPVPSMAAGALSRRRRTATIVAVVVLALSLLLLFNDDILGNLGLPGTIITVVAVLVLGAVVAVVLTGQRRNAARAVIASGRVGETLWAAGVQATTWPGRPPGGRPVFGVLAITAGDVRLVPGPAAERSGYQPWAVPLVAVLGMETTFGLWNKLGGGYIFLGLRDGTVLEFVGDGRGLAEACRRAGIAVAGQPA